jgi:uncharacterized SAM-binding protein YcdF (DUF218 family)
MELLLVNTIEAFVMPHGINILLFGLGLFLLKHRKRLAFTIISISLATLYICSVPYTARAIFDLLESYPALSENDLRESDAQAIVVLGAGRHTNAPEYSGDVVPGGGLQRLRYAVYLHKKTGLPILLCGGRPFGEKTSEAYLMKKAINEYFHINDVWIEENSRNTAESAIYAKLKLEEKGINHIFLVSHAIHMPRAVDIFRKAGLKVTPAPTIFSVTGAQSRGILDWLPSAAALSDTTAGLHEILGKIWYSIRYRDNSFTTKAG